MSAYTDCSAFILIDAMDTVVSCVVDGAEHYAHAAWKSRSLHARSAARNDSAVNIARCRVLH